MSSRLCMLSLLATTAICFAPGCGDDDGGGTGGNGGTGATGGSGGEGGGGVVACADSAIDTTGCAFALSAGDDDTTAAQTALIEAQSGAHVCFCPGNFAFDKELSLTVPDVTVRGLGASREDVVFDFANQTSGDDGVTVTSDGFTIENLWVKNTPGNGIVVTGAEDVTFRNLKVSWDAGSVTENGAYAVYPVKSKRVIIEDCEVTGAADAGVYVGQCEQAIVRNNVVYANVAGIEIENTTDAEVYGNEAYDNSAGILVFVLPDLEKKDGMRAKIHDNQSYDNNRENFAEPGTVVSSVPPGLGMLILAADGTEVHHNTFDNNQSSSILIVSLDTLLALLGDSNDDPATDGDPEGTYIHDNTFTGNGTSPQEPLDLLGQETLEDVVWDGVEKTAGSGALCLTTTPPSFRNFAGFPGIGDPMLQTTDTTPHECDDGEQSEVSW